MRRPNSPARIAVAYACSNARSVGRFDDIDFRQLKGPHGIVAAAGIELRAVVRKREQVLSQKNLEAAPSSLHLRIRISEIASWQSVMSARRQCTSGSPLETAGISRDFRVLCPAVTRINLRQMHARLHIARQIFDSLSIPLRGPAQLCFGTSSPHRTPS